MNRYIFARLVLNAFEILACLSGVFYWRKFRNTTWRWFIIYLAVIAVTEIVAEYIGLVKGNQKINVTIYFFFSIPLQFIFFIWLFFKNFEAGQKKEWALAGFGMYAISFVTEVLFLGEQKHSFWSLSYLTGSIVLLLLVLSFLFIFINSEGILNYRQNMMFWACLGLLIFYLGSLPFYGLWNTLAIDYSQVFNVYWFVQIALDCLMYLCFSIAFIWGNPKS